MPEQNAVVEQIVGKIITQLRDLPSPVYKRGVFGDMNEAVEAAWQAQKKFVKLSLADRGRIIGEIRKAALAHAEEVSRMAVAETQMGDSGHKFTSYML